MITDDNETIVSEDSCQVMLDEEYRLNSSRLGRL